MFKELLPVGAKMGAIIHNLQGGIMNIIKLSRYGGCVSGQEALHR